MTGSEVSAAAGDVTTVVAKLLARPVTPDALDSARVRLADTVFAALIGLRTAQGQASTTLAESMYGKSGSLAGQLFRTVAAVRMTEIDDVDLLSCTTPGSVVIPVMLATLTDRRDFGDEWILERKFDGERCTARKAGDNVRLESRTGKDLSSTYPEVRAAVAAQVSRDLLLDGEVVAYDGDQTSFTRLQQRLGICHLH